MIQVGKEEAPRVESLRNTADTFSQHPKMQFSFHILTLLTEIKNVLYSTVGLSLISSIFYFLMEHKILVWLVTDEVLDLMKYV